MRRRLLALLVAGLAAAPLAAAAGPSAPPMHHEFHWSFSSEKGRLGITVLGLTSDLRQHYGAPEDRGILVGHVEPGSAAAAAGLRVGDVITAVQGQPAREASDVLSVIAHVNQGDTVKIDLVRDGHPLAVQAKLTTPPMPDLPLMPSMSNMQDMQQQMRDLPKMLEDMMRDMPWPHAWSWGIGWGPDLHRT